MNASTPSCKRKTAALAGALASCLAVSALADDIDVYTAQIAAQKKPNILFVLDYSGSMNQEVDDANAPSGKQSKIAALKNAMKQVLEDNKDTINAGIGSLYSSSTTGIRWPVSELNADASTVDPDIPIGKYTVKDVIEKQLESRSAGGNTATVDALVEAAQYFRGENVTHNDKPFNRDRDHEPNTWNTRTDNYRGGNNNAAITASYSPSDAYSNNTSGTFYCNDYSAAGGPNYCEGKTLSNCVVKTRNSSVSRGFERLQNLWGDYQSCEYQRYNKWVGAKYNSPIAQTCQANTIVLISDGKPTVIKDGDSLRSIIGTGVSGCEDLSATIFDKKPGDSIYGNCGPEVLRSLANRDQNQTIPGSNVRTYTVGFDIDGPGQEYLKLLAGAGDGEFFKVDKAEQLATAISTIIDSALTGSESFAELSIDVDKANFSHDNRAFFSLFSPSTRQSWNGNLKGYFVSPAGLMDINGQPATEITDDELKFTDNTQSFWSDDIDGNDVAKGGASEQLVAGSRKLYTYTGNAIPPAGIPLSGSDNHKLVAGNGSITTGIMNLANGSASRKASLDWLQTAPMGAPLHSKSVSVDYGNRRVVFIMTNQGLLHAIDATSPTDPSAGDSSGGNEIFAFMPKRLLANLPALQANSNSGNHIYGLDGKITRWHSDTNNDGVVNNGERVLLIFGMRRGGTAYYALDVSYPELPKLEWVLDESNPDFAEMAQTWSRMSLIKVRDNGAERRVLAFTAGYDASIQDTATGPVPSRGNAIYMIDADGNLLWKAGVTDHSSMQYSIPSDLTVIDSDSDGLADRLYVGDVAGQVWRVDFQDIHQAPDVTLMATLDDGKHQPVFYPPSVAMNKGPNGNFLSVSIGTGNRTDPLQKGTGNKLYMLRDTDLAAGAPDAGFRTITPDMLFDTTDNSINSTDDAIAEAAQQALNEARGWYVSLRTNEKALSSLVTFEGKLLATTFDTSGIIDPQACSMDTTGRFYLMDVSNASPIEKFNSSSQFEAAGSTVSRAKELKGVGIPSSPVVVFPKGSGVVQVIVDKETVNLIDQKLTQVYWYSK